MGFVEPVPDWKTMQSFYDEAYGPYDSSVAPPSQEARSGKFRVARFRYARRQSHSTLKMAVGALAEIVSGRTATYTLGVPLQLEKTAHIFELGYGSGNWLLAMSALGYRNLFGYDVDVNSNNDDRLRRAGIRTWHGAFLEQEIPEGAFDCIRLEHVLEHLLNPIEVLEKCRSMLRPNGVLVLNLPCSGSWSEKISLTEHPTLELPRHLYRHTPRSARIVLERSGFHVEALRVYPVPNHLGRVINARRRDQNRREFPTAVFSALGPAYTLASRAMHHGEHMTILATLAHP
jgi:SAM-dependent methyltransferase